MPKLTVAEKDGKLVVISEVQAQGGPPDSYIAVRPDKTVLTKADKETAESFIKDTGGKLYMITHFWHNSDDGGEWLPKSYQVGENP